VETFASLHFPFIINLGFIFFFFLHSSAFGLKEVVVEGNQSLRSAEIIRLTGVVPGTNIFLIDEEQILSRLYLHPQVGSAEIVRKLPNQLVVRVAERVPCALLPVPGGFMVIDSKAIYLMRVGSMVEVNRPVITGCEIQDILPGQALTTALLLEFLPVLERMDVQAVQLISEINLSRPEYLRIVTLDGVEIRVGTLDHLRENLDLLSQILNMNLKRVGAQPVEYVDMSFKGSPVVKFAR
jgi:cell division protein FtsQ